MTLVAALLLCYLLGSIPTAYLVVKRARGIDIRTVGSGNVGTTNALRTAGPWAGGIVLFVDVLKGLVAAALVPRWMLGSNTLGTSLACGMAAVVGHAFPCFLRFRGGKGVATTLGVLAGSSLQLAGITTVAWLVVFACTRYVSVASLAAAAAIPLSQWVLHQAWPEVLIGVGLALLILGRHHTNLQRLLSGTEHRAWSPRPPTT